MTSSLLMADLRQPYPGLRPFLQSDEKLYFGRADAAISMLGRLEDHRFLAVVGGSGSGKSSLVRAGLLPALRQGYLLGAGTEWTFVTMKPGGDPFNNLAREFLEAVHRDSPVLDLSDVTVAQAALQASPVGFLELVNEAGLDQEAPLLLLVDQFEEIFRFRHRQNDSPLEQAERKRSIHEERNEATAFVNALLKTVEIASHKQLPIYVVITLRSDFIGDCDAFSGLPQAVSESQFLVPRMTRVQIQEAIEKPLLLFGCRAEAAMVNQVINDSGSVPDQLPLMQHALMRTWFAAKARWGEEDEAGILTFEDYQGIGRISHALAQHLDEAWNSLAGDREKHITRCLFLCLSERTGEGALVRRVVKLGEVARVANVDPLEVIRVVHVFQADERNFIVASPPGALSSETDLDVSHEALLRQWERLREWLEEEVRSAQAYRRLAEQAALHARGEASLWRDRDLQLALSWCDQRRPNEDWASRYHPGFTQAMEFLRKSNEASRAEIAEKERHHFLESQRRVSEERQRLLRKGLIAMVFATMGSFAAGGVAVWQLQVARHAQAQAFAASASEVLATDPHQAGVYSLAAMARLLEDPGEAIAVSETLEKATLQNFQQHWQVQAIDTQQGSVYGLLELQNGSRKGELIISGSDGSLRYWRDGSPLGKPIDTEQGWVMSLLELTSGDLISGGIDGSLRRWRDGRPVGRPIATGQGTVTSLVELQNGELISGGIDGSLRRWRDGKPVDGDKPIATGQGGVMALLKRQNGELISLGTDGSLRSWGDGTPVSGGRKSGHTGVTTLRELRNGELVTGGADGTLRRWRGPWSDRTLIGEPIQTDQGRLMSLVELRNGELITVGTDGSLRRWRDGMAMGDGQRFLTGQGGATRVVALRNGELVSGGADGILRRWRLPKSGADGLVVSPPQHQGEVRSLLELQNGGRKGELISGGADGTLRRWRDGRPVGGPIATGQGTVTSLVELQNGELISGGIDGTLQRWRWSDGRLQGNGKHPTGQGTVFSLIELDNGELVSGGSDGSLRRWKDGKPVGDGKPINTDQGAVLSLVQLENGELISGGADGSLRRWRDGVPVGDRIKTDQRTVISLVKLENGELVSGGGDGSLRRWRDGTAVGQRIPTGQGWVRSLVELENGELISGGADGSLRRWRDGVPVGDGKRIQTGLGQVISLVALGNGELVSGGPDGSLWWKRPRAFIKEACRKLEARQALAQLKTEAGVQARATCDRLLITMIPNAAPSVVHGAAAPGTAPLPFEASYLRSWMAGRGWNPLLAAPQGEDSEAVAIALLTQQIPIRN